MIQRTRRKITGLLILIYAVALALLLALVNRYYYEANKREVSAELTAHFTLLAEQKGTDEPTMPSPPDETILHDPEMPPPAKEPERHTGTFPIGDGQEVYW